MKKRPLLVTVIGIVMMLAGLIQGILGFVMFFDRNDATVIAEVGQSSTWIATASLLLIALGVLSIVLGAALLGGSKLAQVTVGAFEIAQIAIGVYLVVAGGSNQRSAAYGQIIGALIVLYFLFGTEKAKAFFG